MNFTIFLKIKYGIIMWCSPQDYISLIIWSVKFEQKWMCVINEAQFIKNSL